MHANQPHYLPLSLPFFSIFVGVFVFLLVLLQVGALRYAYMRIGFSAAGAMLVLLGSLVGGYFNIRGPTIIGTKTYAKPQPPKRVLPVRQEREEGGAPPSGSNRSP